ncbi:hypothetical protein CANMA_003311 [Candida margitis]|uniref:uncharacterized protein n=1 Tax=Candida margitis TaxID=1775924 RepID=UPI002225EBC2|nr:uncharacterized protein CANMA_003311 [Candida margitis]KAI5966065.1 hypothetical protein CANMA_003311 [Candida margitis]
MTTPEYSSKEPPQYNQLEGEVNGEHQHDHGPQEQLPAYTRRSNNASTATSISDQESDIISNPENREKQNECSLCCHDCFCGGCFGCCTGQSNMPGSDRSLMGNILVVLCCGAGVQAGLSS